MPSLQGKSRPADPPFTATRPATGPSPRSRRTADEEGRFHSAEVREKGLFGPLFGEAQELFITKSFALVLSHPDVLHIQTFRGEEGDVFALVTSGMSDLPMRIPPDVGDAAPPPGPN